MEKRSKGKDHAFGSGPEMTAWFYEENGQPRGPIEETDLSAMFSSKALPANTRVWT
ncbi:DUF4339 domain-containing protein, partial [Mesorhizobium sp. M7A.T.Ca.TU.009.01.3.1]